MNQTRKDRLILLVMTLLVFTGCTVLQPPAQDFTASTINDTLGDSASLMATDLGFLFTPGDTAAYAIELDIFAALAVDDERCEQDSADTWACVLAGNEGLIAPTLVRVTATEAYAVVRYHRESAEGPRRIEVSIAAPD